MSNLRKLGAWIRVGVLMLMAALLSTTSEAEQGTWDPLAKDVQNYGGAMMVYQGKVFCANGFTWDGKVLSPWSQYGVRAADFTTDGLNLYAAGKVPPGIRTVSMWDGLAWKSIEGAPTASDYGPVGFAVEWYHGELYMGGSFLGRTPFYRYDGKRFVVVGEDVEHRIQDESTINSMIVRDDKLYVGGSFNGFGSNSGVLAWDGTNWSTLGEDTFGASVSALAVGEGYLYAGGGFSLIGGVAARNIARWDGTKWHALGSGVAGRVRAIACTGNKVYVGGTFTNVGNLKASSLAVWDGATWSSINSLLSQRDVGPNNDVDVYQLLVYGKDLLVSGYFTHAGEMPSKGFAIWHPDGRPELNMTRAGDRIQLTWSADQTNAVLEATDSMSATNWVAVNPSPIGTNRFETTLLPSNRFFRLRQAP